MNSGGRHSAWVDTPDRDTVQHVHRETHGHVAGEVVEVAISAVEAFLGRIQDPVQPSGDGQPELMPHSEP